MNASKARHNSIKRQVTLKQEQLQKATESQKPKRSTSQQLDIDLFGGANDDRYGWDRNASRARYNTIKKQATLNSGLLMEIEKREKQASQKQ